MSYPDPGDLDRVQQNINRYPYILTAVWADIAKLLQGDCKDYVLGKLRALLDLDWPIETLKVGIVQVEPENRVPNQTHAVLLVQDEHILDQRQPTVCSITELQRIGYEPIEIQHEGGSRHFDTWTWA